jgi:hypothetical protein
MQVESPYPFRLLIALCLPLAHAGAQQISGIVQNKLRQPLPEAKVCIAIDASRCVFTDDSGLFSIDVSAAIRDAGRKEGIRGGLRLEGSAGRLHVHTDRPATLKLRWFDVAGRTLAKTVRAVPAGGTALAELAPSGPLSRQGGQGEGLRFIRISDGTTTLVVHTLHLSVPSPAAGGAARLAKAAAAELPALQVTRQGYRTRILHTNSTSSREWITLTATGDSGYHRVMDLRAEILQIDRMERTFLCRNIIRSCDGEQFEADTLLAPLYYAFSSENLYMMNSRPGTACTGIRVKGDGRDIVGTWMLEAAEAPLPEDLRAPNCSAPVSPPRYPNEGITASYLITESSFTLRLSGASCTGDEIWGRLSNILLFDKSVSMIENTCRTTAFRHSRGDTARVVYLPQGQQDSTRVTFAYKETTCSYIDPKLFADPPPGCPDPAEKAESDFYACIAGSGFASDPGVGLFSMPKRGPEHGAPAKSWDLPVPFR